MKRPKRDFFKKLNSTAKKCGSFPKKLATLNRDNVDAIKKEFDGLNLSRYVPELVMHIVEAPLRSTDVFPMVTICL